MGGLFIRRISEPAAWRTVHSSLAGMRLPGIDNLKRAPAVKLGQFSPYDSLLLLLTNAKGPLMCCFRSTVSSAEMQL
jgi:hypothetical protein